MNSVKILHAVRSAITAIAELLVGCWLLPEKFSFCPKNNVFARVWGYIPQPPGLVTIDPSHRRRSPIIVNMWYKCSPIHAIDGLRVARSVSFSC